jgi:site-specific DNA-cytosine methylase
MSIDNARDPRTAMVREKYFSLHPKPLERWLWRQGLPQAAERVFWLHWEEGMKRGDWCSELSLRQVARECCVDPSTVTRAYQVLKCKGLIRREDPGRDPANPFQQAIAITEVRVPRELLTELGRAPNRPNSARQPRQEAPEKPAAAIYKPEPMREGTSQTPPQAQNAPAGRMTRSESTALMRKLSERERAAFFVASRDRRTAMPFDDQTALTPPERGQILTLLAQLSAATPGTSGRTASPAPAVPATFAKPRCLSPLEAARLRKSILALVPIASAAEVFRQVLWSVEEGALRRFEPRLAANIALKKIREGAWSRPNRMPPNWLRTGASTETCSAA